MNGQRELRLSTGAEGEAKDTGLALFPGSGTAPERQPRRLVHFQKLRPLTPELQVQEGVDRTSWCVEVNAAGEGSWGSPASQAWEPRARRLRAAGDA